MSESQTTRASLRFRELATLPFRRLRAWRDRRHHARIADSRDAAAVFDSIRAVNHWGGDESVSGPGSSLAYTAALRAALPGLFRDFGIQTVFDAPCGDCHWMPEVLSQTTVDYLGGDIVTRLVEANRHRAGGPRTRFVVFDLTRDPFPAADLWICRDCLFHLSYRDIHAALKNFATSSISHALITNSRNLTGFTNSDIRTGGFRKLDLLTEPFNLPPEIKARIREGGALGDGEHEMCLWQRTAIAAALPAFARRIGATPC